MDISRPSPANRPIVRVPQLPRLVIIKSNYASCIYVFCLHFDRRVFAMSVWCTSDWCVLTLSQVRWGFFRRGPNCSSGTYRLRVIRQYLARTEHTTEHMTSRTTEL